MSTLIYLAGALALTGLAILASKVSPYWVPLVVVAAYAVGGAHALAFTYGPDRNRGDRS